MIPRNSILYGDLLNVVIGFDERPHLIVTISKDSKLEKTVDLSNIDVLEKVLSKSRRSRELVAKILKHPNCPRSEGIDKSSIRLPALLINVLTPAHKAWWWLHRYIQSVHRGVDDDVLYMAKLESPHSFALRTIPRDLLQYLSDHAKGACFQAQAFIVDVGYMQIALDLSDIDVVVNVLQFTSLTPFLNQALSHPFTNAQVEDYQQHPCALVHSWLIKLSEQCVRNPTERRRWVQVAHHHFSPKQVAIPNMLLSTIQRLSEAKGGTQAPLELPGQELKEFCAFMGSEQLMQWEYTGMQVTPLEFWLTFKKAGHMCKRFKFHRAAAWYYNALVPQTLDDVVRNDLVNLMVDLSTAATYTS